MAGSELIRRWARVVESVAAGYRLTIYDYTNDVMVRDEIGRLLASVSPERRSELEAELDRADDLFRGAMRKVDAPVNKQDGAGWWWYRVPLEAGEELERDLDQMGLARRGS
jgi:hypothetical protein